MTDWQKFDRGIFMVNLLGIVYDPKTRLILIGRRENDPYLKELTWCFPGGRPAYEKDLEYYLKDEIKKKTGLEVKIKSVVFAKTYPEKREFMAVYYICDFLAGEASPTEKFVEIKWVKPSDVTKYFTTSLDPKLLEFLKTID